MKKLTVFLMISILFISMVSASPGDAWLEFSREQKAMFLFGFSAALDDAAVMIATYKAMKTTGSDPPLR